MDGSELPQVYGWDHLKTQLAAVRLAELEESNWIEGPTTEVFRSYDLISSCQFKSRWSRHQDSRNSAAAKSTQIAVNWL